MTMNDTEYLRKLLYELGFEHCVCGDPECGAWWDVDKKEWFVGLPEPKEVVNRFFHRANMEYQYSNSGTHSDVKGEFVGQPGWLWSGGRFREHEWTGTEWKLKA